MDVLNKAILNELEELSEKLLSKVYEFYREYIHNLTNAFKNNYIGVYESEEEFAKEYFYHCYPVYLAPYIDYKKVAQDLFIDKFISYDVDNKIHVFRRS